MAVQRHLLDGVHAVTHPRRPTRFGGRDAGQPGGGRVDLPAAAPDTASEPRPRTELRQSAWNA